ncbi:MAG: bifunctional enoyl-CoA hydratase/phosphate acetyltransferase, partial [Desulfosarcina sp.]
MITNKTFDEIAIGDTASLSRTLTKRDVDMFAMLSGDMNPTHFSDGFAKMLMERQKVSGHSMWGGALISSLLGNDLPGPGTVYKSQKLSFHGAVELGDTLTVSIRAEQKHPDEKTVVFDCRAINQRNEEIISGDAVVKAPTKKPTMDADLMDELKYHPRRAFENLIAKVREYEPIAMAVCHPCSHHALEGAVDAAKANLIAPILVGPTERIKQVAEENGINIGPYELVDARHSHESAAKAVELCRGGTAEVLMKGSLHTDEIMGAVVKRDTGLRTELRLSHVFIMDVNTYPKPLFVTDAAINIYPTLEDKVH